jgi:hypothetical protein
MFDVASARTSVFVALPLVHLLLPTSALRGRPANLRQIIYNGLISTPLCTYPTSLLARKGSLTNLNGEGIKHALSPSSMNHLQARVLKAKLMGASGAAELEKRFDEERRRAQEAAVGGLGGGDEGGSEKVEMVPIIVAQGRLYGYGKNEPNEEETG